MARKGPRSVLIIEARFYEDIAAENAGDPNYRSTTRDVLRLLEKLEAQHIDGLVLDLRDNGGGYLPEATALTGLFALIAICGLPRYNHPLFNSKAFDRATCDRFFLCIEAIDPQYSAAATRSFLNELHPLSVEEVLE